MAKKSRRKKPEGAIAEAVVSSFLEDVDDPGLARLEDVDDPGLARVSESAGEPMEPPLNVRLELMRHHAKHARSDIADTIRQLEEWRTEIDATLAYLRGSK